jgi:fatty-acyl-CoA synthase
MLGAKLVYPGPHLDGQSLLEDFEREHVTWSAGVPTIWMGILNILNETPNAYGLSKMKGMLCGGSAPPRAMIDAYHSHGLQVIHGWGMTETSPVASTSDLPGDLASRPWQEQLDVIELQGLPLSLVELRVRDDEGNDVPWDNESMGELEIRGPWVAAGYYNTPEQAERWTEDGWFKTGDIVSMHPDGFIRVQDRSKDVIKSGGEWISSVALENQLMAHPFVVECAVIAVPDEKWTERPCACVVLKEGATVSPDELREFLAPRFAKWWLPDRFEFIDEIPKTSVGKFKKTALREIIVPADAPVP